MRYVIRKHSLDPAPELEISAAEYSALATARKILTNAFAMEEKYEIVLSNLLDLEKEMLGIAATEIVRDALEYSDFYAARSVLNVRLVNLLTATRLYLDQLPQHVGKCLPSQAGAKEAIQSYCSHEYDTHFEYRFMEALRNYVQHRGIPVHVTRHGGTLTSHRDDGFLEHTVDIGAQRAYLEEDGKFKQSVLNEISGDVVDLKTSARKYVELISVINQRARDLVAESVNGARTTIASVHERYAKSHAGTLVSLTAFALNEENLAEASVPLLLEWDDVRVELQKRNPKLRNLARRYATGKSRLSEQ